MQYRFLAYGLISLCVSFSSLANPIWKATKGDEHVYFGGTVHVLSEADFPLPDTFHAVYKEVDELVFETDMAAIQSPEFQQAAMQAFQYPNGKTLDQVLSKDTLNALRTYLSSRGMRVEPLLPFKPSYAFTTIMLLELHRMGFTAQGVDGYFFELGAKDNKRLSWLESPQEQLNFISSLGEDNPNQMVRYSLEEVDTLPTMVTNLVRHWRSGDEHALDKLTVEPVKTAFPEIHESLLVARNNRWIKHIEAMFNDDDVEFILVGVAHLVGEDSVLTLLKQRGYHIEKVSHNHK
ncbi:TraB/GumN family protein [Aestuariibacter sp. AA17]|uniref:TraB/GumN family protein n=1 Tax=Fluctibacter corallii TaxID=2984329 RepID=A0ABT3A5Q4_9ALTE|nr:TraB/GumN family protein [Aestuariibacter sp. AA17]MCV2884010.1 TraB/GumN family protein [Aestuariibacter sp. AA17]